MGLTGGEGNGKKRIKMYHVQVHIPYDEHNQYIYLKGTNKIN